MPARLPLPSHLARLLAAEVVPVAIARMRWHFATYEPQKAQSTRRSGNSLGEAFTRHRPSARDRLSRRRIIALPMRASRSFLRTCALIAFPLVAGIASTTQPIEAAPTDATVTPGEFVIEHPTLINLGFEWHIDGDANRNASVDVAFRKQGEAAWQKAMPLARLHGERVYQRNVFNLVTPNMFAGSKIGRASCRER